MQILLTILLVVCAVAGVLLALTRPYGAFLMILLMFALEQLCQSYFTFFQTNQRLFNYSVVVLAMLAVSIRLIRRERIAAGMGNGVTWLVAAQFALWVIAATWTPAREYAFEVIGGMWPYVVLYLVLMPLLINDARDLQKVLVALMAVGSIVAIMIIANPSSSYYGGRLMIDLGMGASQKDAFGNPLAIADLAGMMALTAALFAPVRGRAAFTVLRLAAFVLGLGLAIGSGSRGQVLATVVAGILFYPMARRVNNPRNFILTMMGLMVLAGGMLAVFNLFIGEQNRERWDVIRMIEAITLRFDMVADLLQAWIARPECWLFGLGTNAYFDVSGGSASRGVYVHNIAVELLCEQGLVGATVFVASAVLTIRAGIRLWWIHRDDSVLRSVSAIFLAICAFALFNALKQGSIASISPFYFWLAIAKVSQHAQNVHRATADQLPQESAFGASMPTPGIAVSH